MTFSCYKMKSPGESWRRSFGGGVPTVSQVKIDPLDHQMDDQNESEIANFYANKSIFITGATGFMGKVSYIPYLFFPKDQPLNFVNAKGPGGKTAPILSWYQTNIPFVEIEKRTGRQATFKRIVQC